MTATHKSDKGEDAYIHGFFHGSLSVFFFTPWVLVLINKDRYLSEFGESLSGEYSFAAFVVVAVSYYFAAKASKRYSINRASASTPKKESRTEPRLPL